MYLLSEILVKQQLASNIVAFTISAPQIARKAQPGQFVVLRLNEKGERIPLTIADFDRDAGTIQIIVQQVGKTTTELNSMMAGENILDLLGPLGTPLEVQKYGSVACIAGGLGAAPIYPKAKALHEAGNYVVTFLGAQTADALILKEELASVSDEMHYATNDGSFGYKGFLTGPLEEYLISGKIIDLAITVGPVPMMKAVADLTKKYAVPTIASLNSTMVDGTGMCGGCRVTVNNEVKFTCVDGPAFDAHQINFDELMARQRFFRDHEQKALHDHKCRLGGGE